MSGMQVLRRRGVPLGGAPGVARRRLCADHLRGGGGGGAGAEGGARTDMARQEDAGEITNNVCQPVRGSTMTMQCPSTLHILCGGVHSVVAF